MTNIRRRWQSKMNKETETTGEKCDLRRQEQEWLEKLCLLIFIHEFIKPSKRKNNSTKVCITEVCSKLFGEGMKLDAIRNILSPITSHYLRRQEQELLDEICLLICIYEFIIKPSQKKRISTNVCITEVCSQLFGEGMKFDAIRNIVSSISNRCMVGECTENEKRLYSVLLNCIWNNFINNNISRDGKFSNSLDSIDLENEKNISDVNNYAESENQEPVETVEMKSFISNKEISKDTNQDKKATKTYDNKDLLKKKSYEKSKSCNLIRDKKVKKDLNLGFIQWIKAKGRAVIFGHSKKKKFANSYQLPLIVNSLSRRLMCHQDFQSEMNKLLSQYDTPSNPNLNVLLLHSKEGCQSAKELSSTYRHCFNIFADCELEGIYSSDPVENRKKAIVWANCIIIVDPSRWLEDATNVSTSEKRSINSLFSRYQLTLLQSIFVYNASLNLKVLHMIEEDGCNCSPCNRCEIGSPISLHSGHESFENCVQTFVLYAEMMKKLTCKKQVDKT